MPSHQRAGRWVRVTSVPMRPKTRRWATLSMPVMPGAATWERPEAMTTTAHMAMGQSQPRALRPEAAGEGGAGAGNGVTGFTGDA